MKRALYLFILPLCVCTLYSQTYYMNIRYKGGTTTSIMVTDIQKLTMSNITSVGNEKWANVIKTFSLLQNYPNPFNPGTTIEFQLPKSGRVEVRIFTIAGQLVRTLENSFLAPGPHSIAWDGRNQQGRAVASGAYIYQVAFEKSVLSRKMLLMK